MIQPLSPKQIQWVDQVFGHLSLEAAVGQLLSISQFHASREYWLQLIEKVPIGSMRARADSAEAYRELLMEAQQQSAIPLLVPANMENGAAEIKGYGTSFPWAMACAAANDAVLMLSLIHI